MRVFKDCDHIENGSIFLFSIYIMSAALPQEHPFHNLEHYYRHIYSHSYSIELFSAIIFKYICLIFS
jgi:hypothetical protein